LQEKGHVAELVEEHIWEKKKRPATGRKAPVASKRGIRKTTSIGGKRRGPLT